MAIFNNSSAIGGYEQTTGPNVPYDASWMYTIFDIVTYSMFISVILGVPGNILTVLVSTMPHNRKHTTSIYMIGLAIPDSLILVQEAIAVPLLRNGIAKFWPSRETEIKYYYFIAFVTAMSSGLILAEMSVDRFLAIRFPMIAKRICTVGKAKTSVALTLIVVTVINVATFFCHTLVTDGVSGVEFLIVSVPGHPEYEILFTNFQLIFGTIIPSVVIFVSNVGIILTVREASRKRAKMGVEVGKDDARKERELTAMLVVISAAYLVLTIPHRLFYVMIQIPEIAAIYNLKELYWNILFNTLVSLVFNVGLFNHAVNFYLYFIAGGKGYREDTKTILRKMCCWK